MAARSHVLTISRMAEMLGENEHWLRDISIEMARKTAASLSGEQSEPAETQTRKVLVRLSCAGTQQAPREISAAWAYAGPELHGRCGTRRVARKPGPS
jgi:hypothetical protein